MPPRREPQRTCVGCRVRAGKGGLVRVVRRPDGGVEIDPTGKAPGRGTYVHLDPDCVRGATRRGALAGALRATLGPAEVGRLMEHLSSMAKEDR